MNDLYFYGMRLRGFSPGCQPMNGLDHVESDCGQGERQTGRKYHSILVYNRKLSEQELEEYELDYLPGVN